MREEHARHAPRVVATAYAMLRLVAVRCERSTYERDVSDATRAATIHTTLPGEAQAAERVAVRCCSDRYDGAWC